MMDIWDWEEEARLDALLAPYRWRSCPPRLFQAHTARKMAMHRAMAAEIDKMFAEAAKDPAAWARVNKPL